MTLVFIQVLSGAREGSSSDDDSEDGEDGEDTLVSVTQRLVDGVGRCMVASLPSAAPVPVHSLLQNSPGERDGGHGRSVDIPVHISLSRGFGLRIHQIEPFMAQLARAVGAVYRFTLILSRPFVFPNDDGSRTFFALSVEDGCDSVLKLIQAVDSAVTAFHQPEYYKDPTPHASLCWCEGDQRGPILAAGPTPPAAAASASPKPFFPAPWLLSPGGSTGAKGGVEGGEGDLPAVVVEVDEVVCRAGNRTYRLPLRRP